MAMPVGGKCVSDSGQLCQEIKNSWNVRGEIITCRRHFVLHVFSAFFYIFIIFITSFFQKYICWKGIDERKKQPCSKFYKRNAFWNCLRQCEEWLRNVKIRKYWGLPMRKTVFYLRSKSGVTSDVQLLLTSTSFSKTTLRTCFVVGRVCSHLYIDIKQSYLK